MKNLVEMPKSKFLRVRCKKCKYEQVIFNKCTIEVKCLKCDEPLANPTGGECHIKGRVLGVLS